MGLLVSEQNFWSKVNKEGPVLYGKLGQCWNWSAGCDNKGYGAVRFNGRNEKAHRIAWLYSFGVVPNTLCVLHRCDNPPCVRPSHLFLGTRADNNADMTRKGRGRSGTKIDPSVAARGTHHGSKTHPERVARGERSGARLHPEARPQGTRHGRAILTEETVKDIRSEYAAGSCNIATLARKYKCGYTTVRHVIKRETWTHVS